MNRQYVLSSPNGGKITITGYISGDPLTIAARYSYNLCVGGNGFLWLQPLNSSSGLRFVNLVNPYGLTVSIVSNTGTRTFSQISTTLNMSLTGQVSIRITGSNQTKTPLLGKKLNQIYMVESHNSHTMSYDKVYGSRIYQDTIGRLSPANQYISMSQQIEAGIKSFKLPVHWSLGRLYVSHGPVGYDKDATLLVDIMRRIYGLLVLFPQEVITIKLDNQTGMYSGRISEALDEAITISRLGNRLITYNQYASMTYGQLITGGSKAILMTDIASNSYATINQYNILLSTRYDYQTAEGYLNENMSIYNINYWNSGVNGNPQGSMVCMNNSVTRRLNAGGNWTDSCILGRADNITSRITRMNAQLASQTSTLGQHQVNYISLDFVPTLDMQPIFITDRLNGYSI